MVPAGGSAGLRARAGGGGNRAQTRNLILDTRTMASGL